MAEIIDVYRDKPKKEKTMLRITLPVPPSVNSMYFNTRGGGRRLTSKAQAYTRDSRALIRSNVEDQCWTVPKRNTWLYADMVFYYPDRRTRDSHNGLKILMDVMQGVVYQNDYACMPRIQSVEYDKDNPRVEIHIFPQTEASRKKGIKATCVEV